VAFTEDEDLDYYLASQALPKEQPAAAQQPGAWQRAAQLLGAQQRPEDPMPTRKGGMSWAAALAAIAGKDPGGVIAADAANRRAELQDWFKRQGTGGELEIRRGNLDARNRELALQERALEARMGRANGTAGPWAEAQRVLTGQPPPDPEEVRAARAEAARVGSFEAPPRSAQIDQPSPEEVERVGDFTAPPALPKAPRASRSTGDGPAAPIAGAEPDKLLVIPGTEVADDPVARRTLGDVVTRRGLEKDLAVLFDAERSLGRMEEIRKAAGVESLRSADKAEYNQLRANVVGAKSKLADQGVVSPTEFIRHVKDLPGLEFSDDIIGNTARAAALTVGKEDYDPTLAALGGSRKALRDAINAGLSVRGLRMASGAKPTPPPAAAEQPPPAGDTLPTTTGKAPPLPADATQGDAKKPRNVIKPNGARVVYPLSDDEYRRLMAKPGWGSF